MAKNIRIMKSIKLLGKNRKYGDTLTESEFASISDNVRVSLIGTGTLEVFDDAEGTGATLQRMESRIDRLQELVESALGINLSGDDSKSEEVDAGADEANVIDGESTLVVEEPKDEVSQEPVEVKRGMTVSFIDDDTGEPVEGKVKSVAKRKKTAKVFDGEYDWDVDISDLTIVE